MDETTDQKVDQPKQGDHPRRRENAVHNTDDEDQHSLRQEESIAEDGWLCKFIVVSRCLRAEEVEGIQSNRAKLE